MSAKATFSDQFAQRAWRRLFWATNFRARVERVAPLADIDASWKSYIDANADWNANIMNAIVGLSRHYGKARSEHLEGSIQELFSKLDAKLADLRYSKLVAALREGRTPSEQEKADVKRLADEVRAAWEAVNVELYVLVRCIVPPGKTSPETNPCFEPGK
jgi:hypothetical protein